MHDAAIRLTLSLMHFPRGIRGLACAALLVAFVPAPAQAAFGAPSPVSPAGWHAGEPRQATDRQGDSTFVWAGGGPEGDGIQTRIRRANGSLTAVHNVTAIPFAWSVLRVAVDDDGDGVIVWDAIPDPNLPYEPTHLWARRVTRYGALGPARMISPASQDMIDAQVAVQPTGRAVITWNSLAGTSYSPWVRTMGLDSALGPARQLGPGPNAPAPTVSIDRRGRSLLAWSNWGRVLARRMTPSGVLRPTHRLYAYPGGDIDIEIEGLGLDRRGAGYLVWRMAAPDEYHDQVWSRSFTDSLRPDSKARRLSRLTQNVDYVTMDTDLQGDSVVAWQRNYFAGAFARRVNRNGSVGKIVKLGSAGVGPVVLDDDGDGIVVTSAYRNGYRIVIRATRISHKTSWTFGRTVTIGVNDADMDYFTAGISAAGRATVAWPQLPDADARIIAVTGR